jgi:L-alanine-DL-glutamate epimerase-like enolase superfamily enzyme
MKIKALDTYFLSAPLPQPVRTSTSTISRVSELIVTLTTDAGLIGIGEAHGPFLSQGGQEGMRAVNQILERIRPLVVAEDPFSVERIWQDLFALTYTSVRGIPPLAQQRRQLVTAISAIDIALWDLMGKATNRPVHALLGGALRSRVPAYVTGFYYRDGERPDDLKREAAMYLEHGYRTLKVKVAGLSPEADAERVGVIRKAVGPDIQLMLDANQGWDLPSAVRAARLCEPHDIFWLEDPMPWYDERHALRRLKAEVDVPISAGETEYTPFGLRTMVAEGLVDYLIIDSTWAGGLTV